MIWPLSNSNGGGETLVYSHSVVVVKVIHATKEVFDVRNNEIAINEVISSGFLQDITCLTLRLQLCADDADPSLGKWDGDTTSTTTNNSRSATIGIQAAVSLYELLRGVLAFLNRSSSSSSLETTESIKSTLTATTLYKCTADEFLKCTSMLYLGQEGTIPKRYGTVSGSRLGYHDTTSTDRWGPSLSHIFQSLVLEAMGQEAKLPCRCSSSIIWLRLVENEFMLHLPSVITPPCDVRQRSSSSSIDLKKEQDCNDNDFRKYYS